MIARVLNGLGTRFLMLGRRDKAVYGVERAVDLYARVAGRYPARFQADHERIRAFFDDLRHTASRPSERHAY